MRIACDTGGTFTDLLLETDDGKLIMYKTATTPADPLQGVLNALKLAAADHCRPLADFLAQVDTFIYGTTHAINAIVTGRTARTALLTTKGHRDILLLREGGRADPFNSSVAYPEPFIPRALTFEVDERIDALGRVRSPLDEVALAGTIEQLRAFKVEAVAVCLLWSIVNSAHERRIGDILQQQLPDVAVTLSHALNPALREYRRASSAAIDASLKPLMSVYLGGLTARMKSAGFSGRLLVLTSQGGMIDAVEVSKAPIHVINSGPSLAPIAGQYYGNEAKPGADIIVADTGGTTYDVSLVRAGRVPLTRDAWVGVPFRGHLTGFPSVDVKSVGAGGGSIARVDSGGVLRVGPDSAGAVPGPACYGRGGTNPTLTDACVALGYIDDLYFLGGSMPLDVSAARLAVETHVGKKLGTSIEEAAAAIVSVSTENMVQAIADITVNQGIDPAEAVLIGGGGAAGLNTIFIARRLGIRIIVYPEVGAALSAAGALMSELSADNRATAYTATSAFDKKLANKTLAELKRKGEAFLVEGGAGTVDPRIDYSVEARYEHQVWEIDVPLRTGEFSTDADIQQFVEDFHAAHEKIFGFRDPVSAVEVIGWVSRARCRLHNTDVGRIAQREQAGPQGGTRKAYFSGSGHFDVPVRTFDALAVGDIHQGPAIVETPFTTIVIDPAAKFRRTPAGSLVVEI
jgi:N-methylhydantoinase A